MIRNFQKNGSKSNLNQNKNSVSKSRQKKKQNKKSSKFEKEPPQNIWSFHLEQLPKKQESKKVPDTKNQQDQQNYYQYKDQLKDLLKRSTLSDMQTFLANLIKKSRIKQLSNTEKYMLAGYIDIYIKENYVISDTKDNSTLTIKKLKDQWARLSQAWKLYKIKIQKCKIADQWQQKEERITSSFEQLFQEMQKIEKKKQKLEPIKKLMKKFYVQLIS